MVWNSMGCLALILVGGLTAIGAGCASKPQRAQESFFPDDQVAATVRVLETQIARGARADATLYLRHFDGPDLNALGRSKLDLMLQDTAASLPLVVYVDLAVDDPHTPARCEAVRSHLKSAGLLASQIRLENGVNPAILHPVADRMAGLKSPGDQPNATADGAAQFDQELSEALPASFAPNKK